LDDSFLAFLGVSLVVICTPGQDTALTIRNTLLGGRRAGVATAAGVSAGQAVWTIAASLGLTAILLASETIFLAIRLAGAAYLVFLGVHALWAAVRPWAYTGDAAATARPIGLLPVVALRQGILSNLGNPKMAVFFTSLLPQFVTPGDAAFAAMLGLGLTFVAMTFAWLTLYAAVVDRAGRYLRRGPVRRAVDAVSGALLVAFGIRLAADAR
jgi:threonine/homoserine/homoserine lactone efflux protein